MADLHRRRSERGADSTEQPESRRSAAPYRQPGSTPQSGIARFPHRRDQSTCTVRRTSATGPTRPRVHDRRDGQRLRRANLGIPRRVRSVNRVATTTARTNARTPCAQPPVPQYWPTAAPNGSARAVPSQSGTTRLHRPARAVRAVDGSRSIIHARWFDHFRRHGFEPDECFCIHQRRVVSRPTRPDAWAPE